MRRKVNDEIVKMEHRKSVEQTDLRVENEIESRKNKSKNKKM